MKLHEIGISYPTLLENKESRRRGIMNNTAKVTGIESAIASDRNFTADSAEQALAALADADPSRNGKFVNWIVDRYIANDFLMEDLPRVKRALENFETVSAQLDKKDINQYRKLSDLEDAIEPLLTQQQPVTGKGQQRLAKDKAKAESEIIINTPNFKVVVPKTEEASCFWGRGTKWCTAATDSDNMFNIYHKQGPIYTIMAKIDGTVRKFQLHYKSDQFMDEKDNPVNKSDIAALSEIPEYKQFLESLISKHYGQYFK